jgi:type I restriction enzyme R subunit
MKTTDTSEKGLENLIIAALTGTRSDAAPTSDGIRDPSASYGGAGYVLGDPKDYDRDHAVDLAKLFTFLQATQPKIFAQLAGVYGEKGS